MKTTIFTRILLATLVPLALVFVLVIYTISNIIYLNGLKAAEEAIDWEARQISRQFAGKLDEIHALLSVVSQTLSDLDFAAPDGRGAAETHLRRLIESDPSLLCAWFVFEDGSFPGKGRYSKSFFRTLEGVREIFDLTDDLLNDPERSPWYNNSLRTGRFYLEMAGPYDYGIPDGKLVTATMTAPILVGGRAIGAVGIDLHHKDMFASADLQHRGRWLIMLLSGAGDVVYSSDTEHLKKNIFDLPFAGLEAMRRAMGEGKSYLADGFAPVAGEDSLICLHPIDSGQDDEIIYLYLSVPVSDINAMARSSVEIIISTSILGFLLLGFSVFVATRNIVRPIKRLTVDFNRISNGDLELGSGDDGPEAQKDSNVVELDILQQSLWKMLEQVSQAHDLRLKAAEER
ncbi:methyl-accepting chemotaxis protein, partial [Desulfovibrio sp. OttesenSCG-928-G11]|nr:methyl-accepting chemotaxis protein [Desulfovibrio sp. OttesenSCG-928-G11]